MAPVRFHHEGTKGTKDHEGHPEIAQAFFGEQHTARVRVNERALLVCS